MKYQFTGDYPETFITLGKELEPGDVFESDVEILHPRLVLVVDKASKKLTEKAEVSENAE